MSSWLNLASNGQDKPTSIGSRKPNRSGRGCRTARFCRQGARRERRRRGGTPARDPHRARRQEAGARRGRWRRDGSGGRAAGARAPRDEQDHARRRPRGDPQRVPRCRRRSPGVTLRPARARATPGGTRFACDSGVAAVTETAAAEDGRRGGDLFYTPPARRKSEVRAPSRRSVARTPLALAYRNRLPP